MAQTTHFRVLSIAPTTRGFGYAVLEGEDLLVAYGRKAIKTGRRQKNVRSLAVIEKMIVQYLPDVLVLPAVHAKGVYRQPRIKELHRLVVELAKQHKLRVTQISRIEVRRSLLGEPNGTKHRVAELLAKRFSDELSSRLPPLRKCGHNEDGRMDMFDAVSLVTGFKSKNGKKTNHDAAKVAAWRS